MTTKSEDPEEVQSSALKDVNYVRIIPKVQSQDNEEHGPRTSGLSSSTFMLSQKARTIRRPKRKHVPHVDVEDKEYEDIDEAVAAFFFGCNIPFDVVESEHFKKLVDILRPSYSPPDKESLSNMLLQKTHKRLLLTQTDFSESDGVLLMRSKTDSSSIADTGTILPNESENDIYYLYKRKKLNATHRFVR